MTIFQCQDSTDGIFSGVYDAWASKLGHRNIRLQLTENINFELFADYTLVPVDGEKAEKVARTLRNRLGEEDYYHIYQATLACDTGKADSIYRTIVAGLCTVPGGSVMQNLLHPDICKIFELSRTIGNEAHRYLGFLRFRELEHKVLFSEIHPEGNILPLIGNHFADRYPGEHFLIYDSGRQLFLVHEAYKQWALVEGETLNTEKMQGVSEQEMQFQKLWQRFTRSIAIKERCNKKLQQQMLPLKFRAYMTEYEG